MKRHIELQNKKITYLHRKNRRSRRMSLVIHRDGSIVVTTPFYMSVGLVERFIREKASWLLSKIAFFAQTNASATRWLTGADYLKYKELAHGLVFERIEYFNKVYNLKYNNITIRNQKSRWGSCSQKGNINFNYMIALLPQRLSDYIIVHELCHLKEFNHSRKFWQLVELAIPDYLSLRRELKQS